MDAEIDFAPVVGTLLQPCNLPAPKLIARGSEAGKPSINAGYAQTFGRNRVAILWE